LTEVLKITAVQSLTFEEEVVENLRAALRLSPGERVERALELADRSRFLANLPMRLTRDFHLRLIRLLNETGLEYLIVGGFAVNAHGYLRASDDFDLWLHNATENLTRFRKILLRLGMDETRVYDLVRSIARPGDTAVYRFTIEDHPVDFMLALAGVENFALARQQAFVIQLDDVAFPYLSLEDLIRAKQATGRPKDQVDTEVLLKIQEGKDRTLL